PRRTALHLRGPRERRQRGGDVVLETARVAALLLGLDLLPVHEDLGGVPHLHVAEHVRVPPDELVHESRRHVVHVPHARIGGDLRVEDDLQQDVAEFVADRVPVAGVDGGDDFVRLLEQVTGEALVRLLGVPRTAAGTAQPRHHTNEIQQPLAVLGGGNGAAGEVPAEVARRHGDEVGVALAGACDPEGEAVPVAVLLTASTVWVSALKVPYFGFTLTSAAASAFFNHSSNTGVPCCCWRLAFESAYNCTLVSTSRITCQP